MSVEERFTYALHHAARMWKGALDRKLRDLGLNQAGWMSIASIAKATSPLSQGELAALVQVEAATMVSTINRLEKMGLVQRLTSEHDRRIKHLALTPKGDVLYGRLRERAMAQRHEFLRHMDAEKLAVATQFLEDLQLIIEKNP
ncbi:MAG: MarR family transcriptional regulator [Asticcacaulis sp.]